MILCFALMGISLLSPPTSAQRTKLETTCDRVIDGWTLHSPDFGEIRFSGIEPPEGKQRMDLGGKVKKELSALVEGKRLRLEFDDPTEDSQGRLLAYVHMGELSLNAWMLKNGYARLSPTLPSSVHRRLLANLENEARENKRGIWALPTASPAPSGASPLLQEKKKIIASKKSGYYYRPGQHYYDKVEPRHRVYFDNEEAARDAGFRPYLKD